MQIAPPLSQPVFDPQITVFIGGRPGSVQQSVADGLSKAMFSIPWQTWFQNLASYILANTGGGGGGGIADTDVLYSKAGVMSGDDNLQWIYGSQFLKITNASTANQVTIGGSLIQALYHGLHPIWYLIASGSNGLFAIGNGSGSGGFDGTGGTIYGDGSTGTLQSLASIVLNPAISALQGIFISPGAISIRNPSGTTVASLSGTGTGLSGQISIFNGSGAPCVSAGFNGVTGVLLVTNTSNSNMVTVSGASVTALHAGVAGDTSWFLASDGSGKGLMGLSDGSGSGGWDANGAQIYGAASTGTLQLLALRAGIVGSSAVSVLNATSLGITNTTGVQAVFLGCPGGAGAIVLKDAVGGIIFQATTGVLEFVGLQSSSPGPGTDQFWYDPADGNRVKYAA